MINTKGRLTSYIAALLLAFLCSAPIVLCIVQILSYEPIDVNAVADDVVISGINDTVQLETPTGLYWDSTDKFLSRWNAVDGADSYTVTLFVDGDAKAYVTTSDNYYDWEAEITQNFGSGTYAFTVIATSEDESYTESDTSEKSDEFKYWQMPSISSTAWKVLAIIAVVAICVFIAARPDKYQKKRTKIVHKKKN